MFRILKIKPVDEKYELQSYQKSLKAPEGILCVIQLLKATSVAAN